MNRTTWQQLVDDVVAEHGRFPERRREGVRHPGLQALPLVRTETFAVHDDPPRPYATERRERRFGRERAQQLAELDVGPGLDARVAVHERLPVQRRVDHVDALVERGPS